MFGWFPKMFGWVARKTLLYVVIVVALLAGAFVMPRINAEWKEPAVHLDKASRLAELQSQLNQERDDAQQRLLATARAAQGNSVAQLNQALAAAIPARDELVAGRRTTWQQRGSLATMDTDALLADRRRELQIQLRNAEISGLTAARNRLVQGVRLGQLTADVNRQIATVNQLSARVRDAQSQCRRASQDLETFEARWSVRLTFQYYDQARHGVLEHEKGRRCAEANRLVAAYRAQRAVLEGRRSTLKAAAHAYQRSHGWVNSQINTVTGDLEQRIAAERTSAEGSLRARLQHWAEEVHLVAVLRNAAIALALIIASPFLIRLFCYFILAPAAMRRPAIRLRVPGGAGADIPLADRSTTSVGVRLGAGEELLVRQDYLQTTSHAGTKGTQWFLNWRIPLTSIATGLTFLTRIRGDDGLTTVSGVNDPFAEVTVLTLPEGSSCVLQPRALAAVAQPVGRPLRIETKWRISSLDAWLTMQLRYVVFHGPARLVLKGGRGVRMERAEWGRTFGQDQLVGFSADLAYSVTRTETFWPYFLGREQLLKDRVEAGKGVLIVEETPLAGRRAGEVRKGIEGLIDAGMKVFGM